MNLEPPVELDSPRFRDWLYQLWKKVTEDGSGIVETNHAALGNLNSTNYAHLTLAQQQNLTTGTNSALHYHSSDRDRANHTGTQPITSIANYQTVFADAVRLPVYTVATLPAAPTQGDRALCTDLLAPAFLVAAAGTGAVIGPVFFNGAAWIVG